MEARFPLQSAGAYLGAVQLAGGDVLPLAPLSLPYSPEFEPRADPNEGEKTLNEIARVTGGTERTTWDDAFDARRLRNREVRDLVIPLTLLVLVLHVAEIAGRRLLWFAALQQRLRALRWPRLSWSRWRRARPAPASPEAPASSPTSPVDPAPPIMPPKPVTSPLARAKAKARDRLR
jgi:hypothetical protein